MGRILAIDYGKKRTGIAVTDTLQIIANGLATIPTHELEKFLADYTQKEDKLMLKLHYIIRLTVLSGGLL